MTCMIELGGAAISIEPLPWSGMPAALRYVRVGWAAGPMPGTLPELPLQDERFTPATEVADVDAFGTPDP